ncbi:MAG: aspartate carbamoyltransferase [Candidatus Poseidoniales archaeon]|jgi:aspartate carbamoyltransferase catalytic subunit|nr:aspartate carbamoyltransferase [Euryarchaeota archaeon]MDA7603281.1 aspartate carbamoyltransferase [Euryarchaeota archaeon]MDC0059227.1 aspartate carbamoyltransferase [Euryarchaeota archaeon]RCH72706.1 MAG: aspartate carbamoyltransferase [Candidatus Poseidoniales archaeon]|tara:strand:+ start:10954 stop:11892 length:939 start_codon:yes stop_codon:yes gene_type:complete
MSMGDLITMDDLTNEEILQVLDNARSLLPVAKGDVYLPLLQGKVLGNLFFENSTRTRMSFETAMKRLGGEVLNLSSIGSSVAKGETLYDTMQMVDGYADIAVIRHPNQGAAQYSADAVEIPILNGGDGAGNHPTQTMLDLFTIREAHGSLEGLNVMMVGDLRYGRTTHSLSHALVRFGAKITLVSPESLRMPDEIVSDLISHGGEINETEEMSLSIDSADVIYMTRIQKERFPDEDEYIKVAGIYKLTEDDLSGAKAGMIVMHPLPRVNELDASVDSTKHARYFQQAFNGVPTRMALLCRSLGVKIPKKVNK